MGSIGIVKQKDQIYIFETLHETDIFTDQHRHWVVDPGVNVGKYIPHRVFGYHRCAHQSNLTARTSCRHVDPCNEMSRFFFVTLRQSTYLFTPPSERAVLLQKGLPAATASPPSKAQEHVQSDFLVVDFEQVTI